MYLISIEVDCSIYNLFFISNRGNNTFRIIHHFNDYLFVFALLFSSLLLAFANSDLSEM